MLQLQNQTPFAATIAVLPDRQGIDTVYVIVKGTCSLRPRMAIAEAQAPIVMADEYWGEPDATSLRSASEMHIGKPGTDVLLSGRAWAPDARPVRESLVTLAVAERRKSIRVIGDRLWRDNGAPGEAEPFASMPLVWERAFGGVDRQRDKVLAEERNPVGVGFKGARTAAQMAGHRLPNLEDAGSARLERLGQTIPPACFAPVAPAWLPRRAFAGTYDAEWQRKRAPYLPSDFDSRFFQCAAPEMTFDRYLQGAEPISVEGATADGPLQFAVPYVRLAIEATVAGAVQRPVANLETILVEPDANRVALTWRAALPCDRQVLKVEKIAIAFAAADAGA